jgi:hypothetical protein
MDDKSTDPGEPEIYTSQTRTLGEEMSQVPLDAEILAQQLRLPV